MDPLGLEQEFHTDDHEATFDAEKNPAVDHSSSDIMENVEELSKQEEDLSPSEPDASDAEVEPQDESESGMNLAEDVALVGTEHVEMLEKRLDQHESEIYSLKQAMVDMTEPQSNQEQVDAMQKSQEKLAKEVADLNSSLDAFSQSKSGDELVQALKERVDEQDNQIVGCQSLLEELSKSQTKDSAVEPLEKRIEQQENEINNLKTALAAAIQAHSKKDQEALEKRIVEQESEIANLNTCMADMQKRLKEVEATLAQISTKKSTASQNHVQTSLKPSSTRASATSRTVVISRSKATQHRDDAKEIAARKSTGVDQASRVTKKSKPKTKKSSATGKQPSYNEEDGSVRIFLRGRPITMYKPSDLESYDISQPGSKPDNQLQLEWVYGYRGKDCRSNLYFLPSGEIVYFIAAVIILYDPARSKQRHYTGHNDDVKCMALHPNKTTVASGQVAGVELDGKPRHPQVHVWDVETLATLHIIQPFDRAVAAVGFSVANDGAQLCCVDESNDHVLTVWNWQKEKKIAEAKSSKDQVFGCEFNTHTDGSIVTYGKGHINFWTLEGSQLTKKQGLFEKADKPKYLLCVAFTSNGEVLSGDSNGNIQVWGKGSTKKISRVIENAHEGPVFSIFASSDFYVSAGKDGKIRKWSAKFAAMEQTEMSEDAGAVRVVTCNDEGKLLVGTRANRVFTGTFDGQFKPLVHGHVEELWGLAVHSTNSQFLTGGHDKNLILWDTVTHLPVWSKVLNDGIQSAAFHPVYDNIITVGMTTGRWVVLDSTNLEVLVSNADGPEQHDVIRYSPDGTHLAIGSHDNNIYIYNVTDDGRTYTKTGQCSGHSSYITHFDWSSDGQYIQSNSGDYELLYWDVQGCKQMTSASSMRDVTWDTQTCVLGFSVLGIWPEGADGTDINCAGKSSSQQLLATGDDFGKVHLFPYPCSQPRSASREYGGHSSHVTSVGFLASNNKLLTTGGQDCSIMQWNIV